MDTARWQQLSSWLDQLLELAPAARQLRLQRVSAQDPTLGRELERLLRESLTSGARLRFSHLLCLDLDQFSRGPGGDCHRHGLDGRDLGQRQQHRQQGDELQPPAQAGAPTHNSISTSAAARVALARAAAAAATRSLKPGSLYPAINLCSPF